MIHAILPRAPVIDKLSPDRRRQSHCAQCGEPNPPQRVRFCSAECSRLHHNAKRPTHYTARNKCRCGALKHYSSKRCRSCANRDRKARPYKPASPVWCDEDVQNAVIDMAVAGVTRTEIAARLGGGVTKNMVCGFLDRAGFKSSERTAWDDGASTTMTRLQALLDLIPGDTRTPEEIMLANALRDAPEPVETRKDRSALPHGETRIGP